MIFRKLDIPNSPHPFFLRILYIVFFVEALNSLSWVPKAYEYASFASPLSFVALIAESSRYDGLVLSSWAFVFFTFFLAIGASAQFFKIGAALSYTVLLAIRNSNGGIANNSLAPLWILIFLSLVRSEEHPHAKQNSDFFLWMTLFSICLFYFIPGLYKLTGFFSCFFNSKFQCVWDPQFSANLVARELVYYHRQSLFGDFVFKFPLLFNFSLVATCALEIFAIVIPFRLRLIRPFILFTFLLHLLIQVLLGINFTPSPQINLTLLALFFLNFEKQTDDNAFSIQALAVLVLGYLFYTMGHRMESIGFANVPGSFGQQNLFEALPFLVSSSLLGIHCLLLTQQSRSQFLNLLLVPNLFVFMSFWEKSLFFSRSAFLVLSLILCFCSFLASNSNSWQFFSFLPRSRRALPIGLAVSFCLLVVDWWLYKRLDIYIAGLFLIFLMPLNLWANLIEAKNEKLQDS